MAFGRKRFDHDNDALDVAEACLSAAVAGSDYRIRLEPYQDDFVAIADYFHARCPVTGAKLPKPGVDTRLMARMFLSLVRGEQITGMKSREFQARIERCRRKLAGKLFAVGQRARENATKGKCEEPENHKQPCWCKAATLARLAALEEANESDNP